MSIFRTLLLNNNSEPRESQIIKYKATSKLNIAEVADTKVRKHEYNQETGEGIIVCARDITEIKVSAFNGCKELTDIVIPKGVITIRSYAFDDCILNSIVLPNTIKTISTQNNCLVDKICVDSIDFWFNVNRDHHCFKGSFYNNNGDKITEVTVPNEVSYINSCLFKYIEGIETINIGNNISEIKDHAFDSCVDLKTVNIENTNPVSVGEYAFQYSENLENINTSSGISIDGYMAFYSCKKLKNITVLSNSMTLLPGYTFAYCHSLESINIPSSITQINDYAFRECKNIKHIILPDTITKLGEYIFNDCVNLLTVHFPINYKSIPIGCFHGCTSLYEINIDNVNTIGNYAFKDCSSLSEIVFSENLSDIASGAFYGTAVSSIILPQKITRLNYEVFSYCNNLEYINIPNTVTRIDRAFTNCDNLKEVNISANVNFIESLAFSDSGDGDLQINVDENNSYYCSDNGILFNKDKTTLHTYRIDKLQNEYIVPDTVNRINAAFYGCKYLKTINLNKVTTIGYAAFVNCTIEELTLPSSVNTIDTYSIYNCDNLKNIYIPFNITKNLEHNFDNCHNLNINVNENNSAYCSIDGVLFDKNKTKLLLFRKDTIISNYEIPNIETITAINDDAFYYCENLISVNIPNTITTIGNNAFYKTGLVTINLPENVISIGDNAFNNCVSLESVYINSTNLKFGTNVFADDTNLKYIHIKSIEDWIKYEFNSYSNILDNVGLYINNELVTEINLHGDYTINYYAFHSYKYLTKINLDITEIGKYSFCKCENITEVNINCPIIKEYAFWECNNLKTILLGQKTSEIINFAFAGCNAITKVNIDSLYTWCNIKNLDTNLMSIAKCLYINNKVLTGYVTIPEGISVLNDYLFAYMSFITKVIISEGVTTIGNGAFTECVDLKEVDISSTVTDMRDYNIFAYSPNLKTITVRAKTAPSISGNTFRYINEIGTLYYPKGSDYSKWIEQLSVNHIHWTFVETEFE